ncbi:DNA alkylation repair protein [Actinomadura sp. NEAU-AAG7]|uniref:DNA alkylation repair protein n=1 Tax=Actinomadura sp. NEAU-AAG7 TaxID=2839640 RepID=UPI001BE42B88|nr:DNA alkylation repair protein [Actinomadura sp. NEAU-AAG7]MBT2210464.1 DNA alkylation repair protein [Actinomadura sp. NEAU-AAG7]
MDVDADVEGEAARVLAELRALGEASRAESERRYLKSDLAHIGVPVPALRKVAHSAVRREPSREDLLALVHTLWTASEGGRPVHEARMAAIEVLSRRVNVLQARDLPVAERLIRDSVSWVYVDHLAEKVVGALVVRDPDLGAVLDAWVGDPYMWIRRTAMLALLPGVRTGEPDLDRLARFGEALIGEKEFFIRKALGWVLREHSKRDPAWVTAWVDEHIATISGVTFREAVRRLPEPDAARLRSAYRTR